MANEKLYSLEIRVAANGYLVLPPYDGRGVPSDINQMHVFEDFSGLSKWLEKHMVPPEKARAEEISRGTDQASK